MDDYKAIVSACFALIVGFYAVRWHTSPLRAIPTVGGLSLPGLSYVGALRMLGDAKHVLEEGHRKYPESAFKVALPDKWMIVVSGRSMIEDIRKHGDEELSSTRGIQEALQLRYLLEPSVIADPYLPKEVKEKLPKRLSSAVLPDVIDEVFSAVNNCVVAGENEWTGIEVMPVMQKIVARTSSRVFIGFPLCRNEEYLRLVVGFAEGVVKSVMILCLCPRLLKPIVSYFANFVNRGTKHGEFYLRHIVEERKRAMEEMGEEWNGSDKPEIEGSVSADGWTGTAMGKMWKLDSFLRETLRFHGISFVSMGRLAMKDITLHDGTRIPKGMMVAVPAYSLHHDDTVLADAGAFDPFRFARMRASRSADASGGENAKHQYLFTSTSAEYIPFGYGPNSCPGRYFASNELKAILAYIILNYDMKLGGGDGSRPPDVYIAASIMPAPHGRVLFKKRESSL